MSHDDLKSSAQVWGGDGSNSVQRPPSPSPRSQQQNLIDTTPSDAPPSYTPSNGASAPYTSSSSRSRAPLNPLAQLSRLANVPFHQYQIPGSTISDDRTVLTSTHAPFYSRPEALSALVIQQSSLPPKPTLRITGTHKAAHTGDHTVDFDLRFSLLPLLDLENTPTGDPTSRVRLTSPPPNPPSSPAGRLFKPSSSSSAAQSPLGLWVRHFTLHDKSENRSLTLSRTILDYDAITKLLEGHVRTLLASLKYRGKLEVSFPIENQSVTVHRQPGNWFVSMLRLYPVKRYDVVEAVWDVGCGDVAGDGSGAGEEGTKTAERWWREWEGVVRNGVLRKEQGLMGVENWIAWKMGGNAEERRVEWGADWASDWGQ